MVLSDTHARSTSPGAACHVPKPIKGALSPVLLMSVEDYRQLLTE